MHACESVACAEMLLAAGASVGTRNGEGQLPLDVARDDGRAEMVAWLAGKTADLVGAAAAASASAAAPAPHHGGDDEDEDVDMELPPGMVPTDFPDP